MWLGAEPPQHGSRDPLRHRSFTHWPLVAQEGHWMAPQQAESVPRGRPEASVSLGPLHHCFLGSGQSFSLLMLKFL